MERLAWIAAINAKSLREFRRDGLRLILTYAAEGAADVEGMLDRERQCCAFLTFDLREATDGVELTIAVPNPAWESAEVLLEPFLGHRAAAATAACCGSR